MKSNMGKYSIFKFSSPKYHLSTTEVKKNKSLKELLPA